MSLKMSGEETKYYRFIRERFCKEFEVLDKTANGILSFVRDGEPINELSFIYFLRGFEDALACLKNKEILLDNII